MGPVTRGSKFKFGVKNKLMVFEDFLMEEQLLSSQRPSLQSVVPFG
jgi:hypothetical protein